MSAKSGIKLTGVFKVWGYYADGRLKFYERVENLIVNEGLNYLLDVALSAGTQKTTWYVGLKDTGTPAAGDTLASHASWNELTNYTGNRKQWVDGGVSGQSVNNNASPANFVFTSADDIYGLFLCAAETGTGDILFSAVDFATPKSMDTDESLDVKYTVNGADDGA